MGIENVKKIAEKQFAYLSEHGQYPEKYIGFFYAKSGQTILNPWMDPTGRFELSTKEAVDTYGLLNVLNFINEITTKKML